MRRATPSVLILSLFIFIISLFSSACKDKNPPEPAPALKAAFSAVPFEGVAPLTAQFIDESTGSPLSWKWDLQGDGIFDSFISGPVHTYTEPGFYDVKLLVANAVDADSVTLVDYIYLNREDVRLDYEGVISPGVGGQTDISLLMGVDAELAAMTIRLFYDTRLMEVDSIEGAMPGFVSSIDPESGSIIIAWSSVTSMDVHKNDELFSLKATIQTGIDPVSHYMRIGEGTEFADASANVLSGIVLALPKIDTH